MHQTLVGDTREARRKRLLTSMLYAVGTDWETCEGAPAPYAIQRRARLRLGIGLYDHYARAKLEATSPFRIQPRRYGPNVAGLDGVVDQLVSADIVYVSEGDEKSYHLLDASAGRYALAAYADDTTSLIRWVVGTHICRPVGALSSFTYQQADEFVDG